MQTSSLGRRVVGFIAGLAILAFSGLASADPPSRIARLGYTSGPVGFSPAGERDWVQASLNRPLTTGDRLWTEAGARAEIQAGGAMVRMDAGTALSVLNLDDRIAQFQLTQGTLNVRVLRLDPGQMFEVDTPHLAFTVRQPGDYRIEVDRRGDTTTIFVRQGQGEVYGEGAAYVVDSRQPYRFTGTDLREYWYVDAPRFDEFDRWSSERDRRYASSVSARYVSQDVVGYQDLDGYGAWRVDSTYGNVWFPNRVAAGWAPYRDGHWAWVDPWGWTWVDDAPWGFAVSHYGRWANLQGRWGWVPGPVRARAYYAPALVAFVGGANFQISVSIGSVGAVAWFPLGPREVYRPSYPVSRRYFEDVNRSNTVISNTVINNYYNTTNVTNVVYANRKVPGAVVAVPTTVFVQSQPVSRAAVKVARETVASVPVAATAPVAPTAMSVRGAAGRGEQPPAQVFDRPVVARSAPAPAHVGFEAQQEQLKAKPGRPLDDDERRVLRPAAAVTAPAVKVITETPAVPPTVRPPPTRGEPEPGKPRGRSDAREAPAAPASAPAGRADEPKAAAPPRGATPAHATPPPQQGAPRQATPPSAPRTSSEPATGERRGEAPRPGAAPAPSLPPSRSSPEATQRGQAPGPAIVRPDDAKKDLEERRREEEKEKREREQREREEAELERKRKEEERRSRGG